MTHNDNGPGPGQNNREWAVFTFGRKVFFWPKIRFPPPKKHPKFAKRLIFIWEKGTSLFAQLLLGVAKTWLGSRSGCFFWACRKSVFCPFIKKIPGQRAKISSPLLLWGHRLPVTALALSARRLDKGKGKVISGV